MEVLEETNTQDSGRLDFEWVLAKLSAAKKKTPTPAFPKTVDKVQRAKELVTTKSKEVELWHKWNEGGQKPKDLDPLLKSQVRLMQKSINKYRGAEIPTKALEHEHKKRMVEAYKTWDPTKSALGSWVTNNLRKINRYVESHKNIARISENVSKNIGSFNSFKAELRERLGYEPSDQEIHDHALKEKHPKLGVLSLKDISRLNREQRSGFIQTGHDIEEFSGMPNLSSREEEVVQLVYHQLTPDEKAVHEYTFGLHDKPKLKPGAIAKKLKMDNSRVSKLRSSIWKKMEPHLST